MSNLTPTLRGGGGGAVLGRGRVALPAGVMEGFEGPEVPHVVGRPGTTSQPGPEGPDRDIQQVGWSRAVVACLSPSGTLGSWLWTIYPACHLLCRGFPGTTLLLFNQ